MNLGDIYFKTFLLLISAPTIVTFILLGLFRRRLEITWGAACLIALFIAPFAGILLNFSFHRPVFVYWHKTQNQFVPSSGCLNYDPDFARLHATYKMTLPQFNAWVTAHPWNLKAAGSNGLLFHDSDVIGFSNPQTSFETDTAGNGKQLRVYFKSGIMYLSYNSM